MKILFIKFLVSVCFFQILISCHEKLADSKELAFAVKKRKIGRIKPLEIVDETKRLGDAIVHQTDSLWLSQLQKELLLHNDSIHSRACKVLSKKFKNYNLSEVAITKYGNVTISSNLALLTERQIFDAYLFNYSNQLSLTDNVQKVGDSIMLYTKPIIFNKEKCSSCHFIIGKNEFAGMWSVRIRKKLIIENIWLNN